MIKFTLVPPNSIDTRTFTDEELVRHIDVLYPNLRGPLRVMSERFAHKYSNADDDIEWAREVTDDLAVMEAEGIQVPCPHCGGQVQLKLTQEPTE